MKFAKIISRCLSVALLVTGLSVSVSAKEPACDMSAEIVAPTYEYGSDPVTKLAYKGTIAAYKSSLIGKATKSITATLTLKKYWGLWTWNEADGTS